MQTFRQFLLDHEDFVYSKSMSHLCHFITDLSKNDKNLKTLWENTLYLPPYHVIFVQKIQK